MGNWNPFLRMKRIFLAPLSIKIPGVGKKPGTRIVEDGVETVKCSAEIPVEMLENLMGKSGIDLWRKANGIDETPVVAYHGKNLFLLKLLFKQILLIPVFFTVSWYA